MAYQFESRIRFSEVGPDKRLSLVSMVDYFQDCSLFHSESCGLGLDTLKSRGCSWMLLFWQIDIMRRPVFYERVVTKTWAYDFKAFYGYRNFVMLDEKENYLAKANSIWVLMNEKTGRPMKVTPELTSGYGIDPPLSMEYLPRKIILHGTGEKKDEFQIGKHHLDTNNHVNNGQYIAMAEEYLPERFERGRLSVEYLKQSYLHDVIVPYVYREENEVAVSLCDREGKPYTIVKEDLYAADR